VLAKLFKHRILISGILSPFAAIIAYQIVYITLSSQSKNLEKDWLFRLTMSALAMTIPFILTAAQAIRARRRHPLPRSAKAGLILATLSLTLITIPTRDALTRTKQSRNMSLKNVPAPPFDTLDLTGHPQRLADHKGQVILVNIWATWCAPCRAEMPHLDALYRSRQQQGLIIFGLSDEDPALQRKFTQEVPVTYPLLTLQGQVPNLYRDIARYPAIFLIDRQGQLQPAPGPGDSFEKLEGAVDNLLKNGS
jgi:thiol-disulfide isomerase/thioredoxin